MPTERKRRQKPATEPEPQGPRWQSRIIGHGEERADQLLANPRNWRIHPKEQQDVLNSVLDTVGWVQQVVVNQRTGFVVDGHLRAALAISHGEESVPVVYVDLTEEEEAVVLTTFDPIGQMAERDDAKLRDLLSSVSAEGAVADLLASMAADLPAPPAAPGSSAPEWQLAKEVELMCPVCTYAFMVDPQKVLAEQPVPAPQGEGEGQ